MRYLFILGNAYELAKEEVVATLPVKVISAGRPYLLVASNAEISPQDLNLLGGTVKVAVIFSGSIEGELIRGKNPGDRINFGLSGQWTTTQLKKIKQNLASRGYKARFVLPAMGERELSSVVVAKQKLAEIYLVNELTAKTVWVQDFEDWDRRDYGRPAVDPHIGMLPPKVARVMVNIAKSKVTLLDPFCGVGTILAEALLLGNKVIGADINSKQIEKTKKNLEWLAKNYQLRTNNYELLTSDARTISQKLPPNSVDVIVTESYLGPDDHQILERLYLDSLADWRKILKPAGKVVIATPFPIDKEKLMGYSLVAGPFAYFRPKAVVRRSISVLEFKN